MIGGQNESNRKSYGIIYKATNKINGKCYIGQTVRSLEKRKKEHKRAIKHRLTWKFYKDINKYKWNNFKWIVLERYSSKKELDEGEKYWIKYYNSTSKGYNKLPGGKGVKGENNPRYGDHRTWEELHGKEKANELKKLSSSIMKDSPNNIRNWVIENNYNPMNYKEHRETLSKVRTGTNNPAAIYNYKFILPDGKVYETGCLRKFCRDMNFNRKVLIKIIDVKNYKSRNPYYQGWKGYKERKKL